MIKRFLQLIAGLFLFSFLVWSTLAIRFFGLPGETLPLVASCIFAVSILSAFIFLPNRKRTAYVVSMLFVLVILAWSQKKPSHDRDWLPSVANLPRVKIDGNQAQISNIRNFDYETENDFTPRYYERTYDLNKLETVDYALSYWDGNVAVAHTILSFGFADGEYLAVSVETRLEQGEPQSGLRGLFKQYELIYILGDERDLLRLRTNYRREEVFLYPTTVDRENVRKLFTVIMERVNNIASEPEFYNTLSQSCLSSLVSDFKKVIAPKSFFDFRRIQNGYSDEMLYENGWIDPKFNFEETKKIFHINQYVQNDITSFGYSTRIRPQN
jgi:Domain of unknown function (DUF4105)